MKDIIIYTHFHKNYLFSPCDWYTPLSNEINITEPKCQFISKYNSCINNLSLAEYSSFSYIHNNPKEAKYVGVNHYRRYPDFLNQSLCLTSPLIKMPPAIETFKYLTSEDQKSKALDILKKCDIIHYSYRKLKINYVEQWSLSHPAKAFDILLNELGKTEYKNSLNFFHNCYEHIWCSPFITTWEIFHEYMEFYFNIINRLILNKEFIDLFNETTPQERLSNKRLLAFLGERLAPFWCFHKNLNMSFVPLVFTGND